MALRFVDSFDHYSSALVTRKWTATAGTTPTIVSSGRNAGSCLRFFSSSTGSHVTLTLDNQASWVIGCAVHISSLPSTALVILALLDAGTTQCYLQINTDGTLTVTRSGTALTGGTSTLALSTTGFFYIEFKVTIANSIAAGSCKVNVNGVTWITVATGQDTQFTANATANQVRVGQFNVTSGTTLDIDDLYILDGNASTPANNDFLGDVRVECLYPTGAGANTTWTPNASTNFSRVNETTPDDDTTYVEDSTAGHRDTYAFGDMSSTPTAIFGVQTVLCARKTDAGARNIASVCKSGATTNDGASMSVGDSYLFYSQIREADPNTGAAWTAANLNAAEFGEKLVS